METAAPDRVRRGPVRPDGRGGGAPPSVRPRLWHVQRGRAPPVAAPAERPHHAAAADRRPHSGVCHEKEGCMLMPVGAPSYALSNLEHAVVGGLTPTWFREVQDAFYYGGLTGGWLIIIVAIWLL